MHENINVVYRNGSESGAQTIYKVRLTQEEEKEKEEEEIEEEEKEEEGRGRDSDVQPSKQNCH